MKGYYHDLKILMPERHIYASVNFSSAHLPPAPPPGLAKKMGKFLGVGHISCVNAPG